MPVISVVPEAGTYGFCFFVPMKKFYDSMKITKEKNIEFTLQTLDQNHKGIRLKTG